MSPEDAPVNSNINRDGTGATSAISLSRASENAAQELADSPLAVL
jgi:hypothetical protein